MSVTLVFTLIRQYKRLMCSMAGLAVIGVISLVLPSDSAFVLTRPQAAVNAPQPPHMAWGWTRDHSAAQSVMDRILDESLQELVRTLPEGKPYPPSAASPRTAALIEGVTFGSQAILERLWTPQERQGSLQDTRIVRLPGPDLAPPLRLAPAHSAPPLARAWRNSIRRVELAPNRKAVALTFDLCERADDITGYDAPIVHYLRTAQVRATFFAGGKWMRSHPEKAMQLMAEPLFEVGNHGWTHGNLRVLKGEELARQILWTQAQYELLWEELETKVRRLGLDPQEMEKIPRRPFTFRFPYGTCSPEALQVLATHGLPAIQWDVVSGDPARHQTAQGIVKTVLSHIRPGSIVVFHANGRGHGTAEALPRLILALQKQGFEFVTVSELLRLGKVTTAEDCYELRPSDNWRYDAMVGEGTRR